jgi:Carbohydrate esterase, sialic acid-specific acetylesterase
VPVDTGKSIKYYSSVFATPLHATMAPVRRTNPMKSVFCVRALEKVNILNLGPIFLLLFSAVSFSQVTLPSGITVPKDKFIVYIMIGHSNMVGRESQLDTVVHPRAWNFFIKDYCQVQPDHTWIPARDCIHMDNVGAADGPCMHFLKKMVNEFPDYYFGVVENANSGVQCRANYQKDNGAGDLDLYSEMVTALDLIKGNVTFGGIVCMLGIPEAVLATDSVCTNFSNDIAIMVQQFRDTLRLPDLPFLMGGFERDAPEFKTTVSYSKLIDSQTNLVPGKVTVSAIIPSDSLAYTDRWHYTYPSYEIWTQRAVDIIKSHGWYPAPPVTAVRQLYTKTHLLLEKTIAPAMMTDALGRTMFSQKVPALFYGCFPPDKFCRLLFSKRHAALGD